MLIVVPQVLLLEFWWTCRVMLRQQSSIPILRICVDEEGTVNFVRRLQSRWGADHGCFFSDRGSVRGPGLLP